MEGDCHLEAPCASTWERPMLHLCHPKPKLPYSDFPPFGFRVATGQVAAPPVPVSRIFSGEEGTSFSNKVFLIGSINWKRAVINERIYGGKNDREIGERNPSISLGAINPRSREVLTHPDPYRSCPLSRCTGKGMVSERQVSLGWPADKSLHV